MAIASCPAEVIPTPSFSHYFCSITMLSKQQCSSSPLLSTSSLPLNSSMDFEFDVRVNNIDQECYSSADELFCNGKILPLQLMTKNCRSQSRQDQKQQLISSDSSASQKPPIPKLQMLETGEEGSDQNQSSKSFWRIKRSSSLNFISGFKQRLHTRSNILSRSSSTGSTPKVKAGPVLGNHRQKEKKNFTYGSHGNGFTVNPMINIPLVDVFCLSSAFLTSKTRRNN